MAFLKALRCVTVLLALCFIMDKVEHGLCLNMVKELAVTQVSPIHARAKRQTDFRYALEVVVRVADVAQFLVWLKTLSPPLSLNESATLTNIDHTTECRRTGNEFLCSCKEAFTWSQRQCSSSERCDVSTQDLCRCIVKTEPLDNQFCQPPIEMKDEFTMDITFNEAYNNPDHQTFKDISTSIKNNAEQHIPALVAAGLTRFRSGSTIAEYSINATSFSEGDFQNFRRGIIADLGRKFRMIIDGGEPLQFSSNVAIAEEKLTMICGPPPEDLNFRLSWTSEWRHNGELIIPSRRITISKDGSSLVQSVLTVLGLLLSDRGTYECLLKDEIVFRQASATALVVEKKPVIEVNTIRRAIHCQDRNITVPLICSVQNNNVELVQKDDSGPNTTVARGVSEINYDFTSVCKNLTTTFTCRVSNHPEFKIEIKIIVSTAAFHCVNDPKFDNGFVGDEGVGQCGRNEVGNIIGQCSRENEWEVVQNGCILQEIQELLFLSQFLDNQTLPEFLQQLRNVTERLYTQVVNSTANIRAIVLILNRVSDAAVEFSIALNPNLTEHFLVTAGILTLDAAKPSWDILNANFTTDSSIMFEIPRNESTSSLLLYSLETMTDSLIDEPFNISTDSIILNRTNFSDSFSADLNSSVEINIPQSNRPSNTITLITFDSMDNVLPARNESNSTDNVINGRVVLVKTSGDIRDVSFAFDPLNSTLSSPQCVFWNFSLFNGLGGWDGEGCELVFSDNETVTCNCSHLTSFSILMSPFIPKAIAEALSYITYIGVSISIAALIICIIIEAVTWRKIRRNSTSYLRHVTIINIAVSLLIANIWFIVGAAISETDNIPACHTATFFIHLFYLALFFWMFSSALLLLYRLVHPFGDMSDKAMLAVGFSLGYGAPIIITVITIAVTAPNNNYTHRSGTCWLNWNESKALLAFVVPALTIVVINLFILFVLLYKMLKRRGNSAQEGDKNVFFFTIRTLALLTPFFGLTWSLGVGTMVDPSNIGIHVSFTVFNSLQGLFVLVFGTLVDKTVRSELGIHTPLSISGTRSTSAGPSSSSGLGFFRRGGRDGYNMASSASNT